MRAQDTEVATRADRREAKRERIREAKRERILDAAASLFFEAGYRSTSMERIADSLGVTKPYLYYHFENKVELLEQLAERVMSRASMLLPALRMEGSALMLTHGLRAYVRFTRAHARELVVLFREHASLSDATRVALGEQQRAHTEALACLFVQGERAGQLHVGDARLVARAVLSLLCVQTCVAPLDLQADENVWAREEEQLLSLALRMLGAAEPAPALLRDARAPAALAI